MAIFANLSDTTAIFYFRLPVTSDIIGDITVELLDAENIELAVEIVFLSSVLAHICVLPVSGRHLVFRTSCYIVSYRGYHC